MSNIGDSDSINSSMRQSPLDALLQCLDDEEFLEEDEDDAKLPSTPSTTQAPPQPSPSPSTQQPQQSNIPTTRAMQRPHRPLNAYNIFFQATRQQMVDILRAKGVRSSKELKELKQKIGFQNLAKTVSNRWKSISEAEKAIYHQRADVERARYYKQMNEWYRINNQDDEEQKEVKEVKEKAPQGSATTDAQEDPSRTAPQPHAWMGTASTSASEAVNSHTGPNDNVSYFGAATTPTTPTTNQGTIPRSLIHGIGPMSLGAFSQTIQNPSADSSVLQDALLFLRPSDTITNQAEPLRTTTATTVLAPAGLLPSPIQPLGRHTVERPHHFEEFKQMDLSSASTTAMTTTPTEAPAFVHVHHGMTQQQQRQNEQKTSLSQTQPQTQQRQPLPQTQPNTQPHTQQQQHAWLHDTPEDARMRLLASRLGPDAVNFVVDAFGPEPQQQPTDGSNNDSRLSNFPLDRLRPSDSW